MQFSKDLAFDVFEKIDPGRLSVRQRQLSESSAIHHYTNSFKTHPVFPIKVGYSTSLDVLERVVHELLDTG